MAGLRGLLGHYLSEPDIEREIGASESIQREANLFGGNAHARLIMTVARRSGRPYSEVERLWTYEDLIREVAWDVTLHRETSVRCPDCGINHDDVRDADTNRPLANGAYKLAKVACWVRVQQHQANENRISEADREAGVRFELAPREPGELWIDNGD